MLETLPVWSNVQPQLQPHPGCLKISKLGNTQKASRRSRSVFSNLVFAFRMLCPAQLPVCPLSQALRPATREFCCSASTPGNLFRGQSEGAQDTACPYRSRAVECETVHCD